jgi:GH35 family endo-1,4-beta-xylanase
MIVNWQLCDRYSWYGVLWKRKAPWSSRMPRPLPFTDSYRPGALHRAMVARFLAR